MSDFTYHGGALDAAIQFFGGAKEHWLDLSTGINPLSYPISEIAAEAWTRLPDKSREEALYVAARKAYGVKAPADILAANGTQALIELLPRLFEVRSIGIVSPTYGEHRHVFEKAGASIVELNDLQTIPDNVDAVVVVNPNNPDARCWSVSDLIAVAERLAQNDTPLIVDEAFCDPMPELSIVSKLPDNAIVLRSFGKFYGLAGVRLGFAIAKSQWIEELQSMIGPWAVSGPALEIGRSALDDALWAEKMCSYLSKRSNQLARLLEDKGLKVAGINPLFVFAKHVRAAEIFDGLAHRQILVRPFKNIPDALRFGLSGNDAQLSRLGVALDEIMAEIS